MISYEANGSNDSRPGQGLKRYTRILRSKADVDPVQLLDWQRSAGGLPDKDAQYYQYRANLPIRQVRTDPVKELTGEGFLVDQAYTTRSGLFPRKIT